MRIAGLSLAALGLALMVAGCADDPEIALDRDMRTGEERRNDVGQMFGGDLVIFSSAPERDVDGGETGVAVNSFLWRAALDTVSFMPISSADPFGGVILTDWFSPAETPSERLKMNVLVLTRQLRADGIQVSVFRQVRGDDGAWTDSPVAPETGTAIEDAILDRARQLRVASAG